MTEHLILSGGIFHEFDQTTAALVGIAAGHGLKSRICTHPDEAIEVLGKGDVRLFSVNALRWEMAGEKYDPYRDAWRYSISQKAIETISDYCANGGGLFGLHTASICFSDWPEWGDLLGGRWIWQQSYHPDKERLSISPTEAGAAWGLDEFTLIDELYSELELAADTEVLMNGRNETGSTYPVVWRRTDGRSRIAYDALGHDCSSLKHPAHARLVSSLFGWILNG